VESSLLNILAVVALILLVGVTGGVVYLTLADCRDRRRREEENREMNRSTAK